MMSWHGEWRTLIGRCMCMCALYVYVLYAMAVRSARVCVSIQAATAAATTAVEEENGMAYADRRRAACVCGLFMGFLYVRYGACVGALRFTSNGTACAVYGRWMNAASYGIYVIRTGLFGTCFVACNMNERVVPMPYRFSVFFFSCVLHRFSWWVSRIVIKGKTQYADIDTETAQNYDYACDVTDLSNWPKIWKRLRCTLFTSYTFVATSISLLCYWNGLWPWTGCGDSGVRAIAWTIYVHQVPMSKGIPK